MSDIERTRGEVDEEEEKPKIVIDLNECSSASALDLKIANHSEDAAPGINRLGALPDSPLTGAISAADRESPFRRDNEDNFAHRQRERDDLPREDGHQRAENGFKGQDDSKAHFVGGKLEYCICRKPDISRFMIGCDRCNEWFHGDCIGIREDEARSIRRWYCRMCRSKDPNLQIDYKPKPVPLSPHRKEHREGKSSKSSKRCGECSACHQKEDCGRCDHCRDMKKFGGPFKKRQKCRQRQCLSLGRSSLKHKKKYRSDEEEDDFFVDDAGGGGDDAVVLSAVNSESEDGLFTGDEDDNNDANGDSDGAKHSISRKSYDYDPDFRPVKKKHSTSSVPKPRSINRKSECGGGGGGDDNSNDAAMVAAVASPDDRLYYGGSEEPPRRKTLKLKNVDTPKSASLAPSTTSSEARRPSHSSKNKDKTKDKRGRKTKKSGRAYRGGSGNDLFSNSFLFDSGVEHHDNNSQEEPSREEAYTQCYGPGCTRVSRPGSKYCSDDCGLKLATNRLYELLPQRIQQWQSSSCAAEGLDMKKLEKIRQKLGETSKRLSDLDEKHKALDAIVERAKAYKADPNYDPEDEDETEMMFYCVTCGHEVNVRRAATHMERCFTRFESQTSFGSLYRTNIEGQSFFCDAFNKESNTYCKRLRVICPEHFKDKKVEPNEICGCPLTKDLFVETSSLCKAPKKKCQNHINWERLRRAEIDMERVRDLMDLEDLYEEERTIRQGMASRAGVLGLMLHSTIDHEALARQVSQMQSVTNQQQQQQIQ